MYALAMGRGWGGEEAFRIRFQLASLVTGLAPNSAAARSPSVAQTTMAATPTLNTVVRSRSGLGADWTDDDTWALFCHVVQGSESAEPGILAAREMLGWGPESDAGDSVADKKERAIRHLGRDQSGESIRFKKDETRGHYIEDGGALAEIVDALGELLFEACAEERLKAFHSEHHRAPEPTAHPTHRENRDQLDDPEPWALGDATSSQSATEGAAHQSPVGAPTPDDAVLQTEAPSAPDDCAQSARRKLKKRKRLLLWWTTGAVAVLGLTVPVVIAMANAASSAEAEVVAVAAPKMVSDLDWEGAKFWLPAEANSFAGLPTPNYDCANPDVRSWLLANGQLQRGIDFRVRNIDSTVPLSIEKVTARGQNSPATPGFFFTCEGGTGGDNGEISYSHLALDASDESLAGFTGRKASDFQRTVAPFSTAGIYVTLAGEEDFSGTLLVDTRSGADPVRQGPVASSEDPTEPLQVVYHGMPAGKKVTVQVVPIGAEGQLTLLCATDKDTTKQCTLDEARTLIAKTWGLE